MPCPLESAAFKRAAGIDRPVIPVIAREHAEPQLRILRLVQRERRPRSPATLAASSPSTKWTWRTPRSRRRRPQQRLLRPSQSTDDWVVLLNAHGQRLGCRTLEDMEKGGARALSRHGLLGGVVVRRAFDQQGEVPLPERHSRPAIMEHLAGVSLVRVSSVATARSTPQALAVSCSAFKTIRAKSDSNRSPAIVSISRAVDDRVLR